MEKTTKSSMTMMWLCFFAYALLSMSKTAFSSSMAAMIHDGLFTNSQAGIINAGFYLLYGIAQLIGAGIVDRISPVILLTTALVGAVVTAIGMAVANSFILMLIIWSLCGLLQFASWPCIIKIIAEYLVNFHRKSAMTIISFAFCVGNLFNYLSAAIILNYGSWRLIFILNSAILTIFTILWLIMGTRAAHTLINCESGVCRARFNPKPAELSEELKISYVKLLSISGILLLLVPGFIRTALDIGIKSWIPTIMVQTYGISPSFATTLTTILMIVNLSGVFIANILYPKAFKSPVSALTVCFIVCLPTSAAMMLIGGISIWAIVALLIFFTTIMYSANQLLNVIVPTFFNKYNRSGSVAGILNAAASFGAVASSFGYGFLADKFGWTGTILSWSIIGAIAIILCSITIPIWNRFTKE